MTVSLVPAHMASLRLAEVGLSLGIGHTPPPCFLSPGRGEGPFRNQSAFSLTLSLDCPLRVPVNSVYTHVNTEFYTGPNPSLPYPIPLPWHLASMPSPSPSLHPLGRPGTIARTGVWPGPTP